ncbi:MAG TPA: hypothetical protein PKZ84_01870 [Anaerolineae bacterium]|nr:hypothetical protein [Anaerolineae bacterium]HQI83672.1 hypothetical protein [Anaerolineae bacterium]
MPICRTCRGEYERSEPPPSPSGEEQGDKGASRTAGPQVCPRCGADVRVWEEMDLNLPEFILWEGGIMGLMPAALALAVWLFFWIPREISSYYYPVLTAVSVGFSALLFFVIYAERLVWWERWWAVQVYRVRQMSIISVITMTAIAGILLSALWLLMYTTAGKPVGLVNKGLFALIYVASYVCLTVAVTLGFVQQYVERLLKSVPPPVFASTKRLSSVVVDAAIQSINLIPPGTRISPILDDSKPVCEVLGALRDPTDGGIEVLLRERKRIPYPTADGQMKKRWTETFWGIKADRWGHIKSLQPEPAEPYKDSRRILGDS